MKPNFNEDDLRDRADSGNQRQPEGGESSLDSAPTGETGSKRRKVEKDREREAKVPELEVFAELFAGLSAEGGEEYVALARERTLRTGRLHVPDTRLVKAPAKGFRIFDHSPIRCCVNFLKSMSGS